MYKVKQPKGRTMSKSTVAAEIKSYLENGNQDTWYWSIDAMAEELDSKGIGNIEDMDNDDFTDFLQDWDGKVTDYRCEPVDFEAAMAVADSELCEQLNDEHLDSAQEYFDRYAELHAEKYDGEEFAPYYGLAW